MKEAAGELNRLVDEAVATIDVALDRLQPRLTVQEIGTVWHIGSGIARVRGLPNVQSEELIRFPGNRLGIAFNLDPDEVAVIMLDDSEGIDAGDEVRRSGRVMDIPVGEGLLGRVIDSTGRPLDGGGPIREEERLPVERPAPGIMMRAPVDVPLQTGLQVIDALIPIGRGQRELILGDRQTGKTAIAMDTIINQKDTGVISIYCAIGMRGAAVAKVIAELRKRGVMDNCIIVVSTGQDQPGHKFIAPYAAATIGEFFMQRGRDVLVVYDDLTRHARAYRELSLLLRRPPAREAYPGDIFYIHSRLLERATHLRDEHGGGSLTALPIVETQAQNVSAYIPTNIISITDGQLYLSPELAQKGVLPAIDVGRSVSRVGGKTQLPAYRVVAGDLRLSYSQFEELEVFARFGTRLDDDTRKVLERGRRVREALKQPRFAPVPVPEQIAVLVAVNQGVLDDIPLDRIAECNLRIREAMRHELPELGSRIIDGEKPEGEDLQRIVEMANEAVSAFRDEPGTDGNNDGNGA